MTKPLFWATLSSAFLAACGGGTEPEVVETPLSRATLMRCPAAPSSPDEAMLACLAGTAASGKDASGNDCKVSFAVDHVLIVAKAYSRTIALPLSTNAGFKDTYFAYAKAFAPDTDALDFGIQVSNGGFTFFNFSFASNAETGRNDVVFAVEEANGSVVNATPVVVKCTVHL